MMNEDRTGVNQITDPPRAGEWDNAILPFGDYNPNLNPDGSRIVFEQLVGNETVHSNYNDYIINSDGSEETAITQWIFTRSTSLVSLEKKSCT